MADILLTGNPGWTTVREAISNGDGSFQIIETSQSSFAYWASQPGARPLVGDFNGDGKSDVALLGNPYWNFVPMIFSNGNGTFTYTAYYIGPFAEWASYPDTQILVGDYNHDGKADIALTGHVGWHSVPVAFSNGDGSFAVANNALAYFPEWAALSNVKALVGDYNNDGRADIALTGHDTWASVPVAFSNGNGTFTVSNTGILNFALWSSESNARHLVGDYNHDGRADIALTGHSGWSKVPVAFSNGDGSFSVTSQSVGTFGSLSADPNAKHLVGDFNGDGKTDLALTGVSGWNYVPLAFSVGNGAFAYTTTPILEFGGWAAVANPLAGDVNGDGKIDIALTGNASWATLPVAFSLTPD